MRSLRLLLLVLLSAVVSAQTDTSRDALFAAIRRGSVADVDRLLKAGASPNIVDADGTPALMAATLFGDTALVKLLLERGADPNRTGAGGTTALMWAVPNVEKVRVLLEHGANVNARSETDRTAFLVAASYPRTVDVLETAARSRCRYPRAGPCECDGARARRAFSGCRRRPFSRGAWTGSECTARWLASSRLCCATICRPPIT